MPREKPPVHGRDHRPGGFDPLAWLPAWIIEQLSGFLHWGTNNDDDNLGLVLDTTGQDIIIESLGGDVGQQVRLVSGGQINSIAGSQNLLEGDTVIVDGSSSVLLEGGAVFTQSANIENKLVAGTDRWRVADAGGSSILEILETGSIDANSHKIHNVTDPTSAQDAATKHYVDITAGGGGPPSGAAGGALDGTYPNPGIAASVAGAGLAETSDVLSVNVDGSTIEINTDTLRVKAGGIGTNEIATDGVGNTEIANNAVTEAKISLATANTTNDVTITKHGFVPIAPNDTGKFLRGDGTWNAASLPSGAAAMATDALWDNKGDLAAATGADAAVKVAVGTNGQALVADSTATAGVAWGVALGASTLLYDYTVVGSDKASIDTGVDTPDAGSAGTASFVGTYRILEIWLQARTDEAVTASTVGFRFNNDSGANQHIHARMQNVNATVSGSAMFANTQYNVNLMGASAAANRFSVARLTVPNYAGTVAHKSIECTADTIDDTDTSVPIIYVGGCIYRSTSAIVRLAVFPTVAGKKLKVGTRLMIYAR